MGTATFNQFVEMTSCLSKLLQYKIKIVFELHF